MDKKVLVSNQTEPGLPTIAGTWRITWSASLVLALAVMLANTAWAFPTYDGCEGCHGSFNSGSYTSKSDGTAWGTDLMSGHAAAVNNDCNACHGASGFDEVFLNASSGSTLSKGCVGCHGREEDVTGNCTGQEGGVAAECGSGAGLRKHHELKLGAGTCSGCHSGDAAPVGEDVEPFNYGKAGVAMKNACDSDGTESQFGPTGLDNDGDGLRDGSDSDCQAAGGFDINAGLNGNWFGGAERNGEGFQFEVALIGADLYLIATFYTYDDAGNQVWLLGVGPVDGDTADIDIYIYDGATFGAGFNPADVNETAWGTGTVTASSCSSMSVMLAPNAAAKANGFTDLEYDLQRVATSAAPCPIEIPN
jgi:predicted CXXCH cytochrome family protein